MKLTLLCFSITLCLTSAGLADNAAVLEIFENRCAECHFEDEFPDLHAGINLAAILGSQEDIDEILDRISRADGVKGRMPKSKGKIGDPGYSPPLTADEITIIAAWVKGETPTATAATTMATTATPMPAPAAPRAFLPLREEVRLIAADAMALAPAKQPFARYLSLSNLANLRDLNGDLVESDGQLDTYRAALGKLLNSVSRGSQVVPPTAINEAKTVYRFDLRDYGWSTSEWETIVAKGYPYGLIGIDRRAENDLADATGTELAAVRADWFVFAVSQPPLYHELLHLPDTEQALERQQGVDSLTEIREGRAVRAGFRESGVSQGNRLIERFEAATGMYWKSYDFTPLVRTGGHDLFRSPLGPVGAGLTENSDREFVHDGGEVIFTLANGLHGYYLATAEGKRLDRGPTEIVQDRKRRDGAIINGVSCMACHESGMKYARDEPLEKFLDEVGPVALKAGLDRTEAHHVEDLYRQPEELHAIVKADEAAYLEKLALAMPGYDQAIDPVSRLYNRFKKDVELLTLAAEFGEEDATFVERLKDSRDPDLESIAAQFEAGLGFPRASWLDQFTKIAHALGYELRHFESIAYTEFTSGAAEVDGNAGETELSDGGSLKISTDKANYHAGELLSVNVKATEGVFLRLYNLSAEKEVTQIFPNAGRPENFIRGGETITLPGPGDKFRFRMKAPFGTEIIFAVASPVQFTDAENLTFASGETFKIFSGEDDLRRAEHRGTKGLEVEVVDLMGKPQGFRSAPVFKTRAVYSVAP